MVILWRKSTKNTVMKIQMTIEKDGKGGKLMLEKVDAEALVALLKGDRYKKQIEELREQLPKMRGMGQSVDYFTQGVPRVYPSGQMKYEKGQLVLERHSGVVLLDIQNVFNDNERAKIMSAVQTLPMTLMAFTGSSGMSVKVLVLVRPASGKHPKTVQLTELFHRAALQQMRALYSTLVPQRISPNYEPKINEGFLLSMDVAPFYNPNAVPAVIDKTLKAKMVRIPRSDYAERELRLPVSADVYHRDYYDRLFDALLQEVKEEFVKQGRESDLEQPAYLKTVVERAAERKVEESEVRARLMRMFGWAIDEDIRRFVRETYESVHPLAQTGNKARDAVRGMIDVLQRNYEFQQNVLSHVLYFRERTSLAEWRRLEAEDANSLTLEVQEAGVGTNTHQIQTFLNSRRIPRVNPIDQLVESVRGRWDGRDRIEALARRVPTPLKQWPKYFHIWFLAMVKQWMTMSPDHGNEVVPLLIGAQGIGKSTFCRRLLPPELLDGYIDHLDFSQEKEVLRAMSIFQLINIDEFNRYSARDQAGKLKNYLQMNDIRMKTPYRRSFEVLQRMASFIGTSNPSEVLADPTGSRRFICVQVTGIIDQLTPIDYVQLYAQAVDELDARERLGSRAKAKDVGRTYFTKAEERVIQKNNAKFMVSSVAVERFQRMFEPIATPKRARSGGETEELGREEIFNRLDGDSRNPLSEAERKMLYEHLKQLAIAGKIHKRRKSAGFIYHVRSIE